VFLQSDDFGFYKIKEAFLVVFIKACKVVYDITDNGANQYTSKKSRPALRLKYESDT
jgi:hypothetical protein